MTRKKSYVNWDTVPVIMDLPIAAHLLGLSADYLRKLAKAGSFPPAFKPSPRAWRVRKDALREWIESQGQKPYA